MNVILIESIGKILAGFVGITVFLRWVVPGLRTGVRKGYEIAVALAALGPFMETAKKDFKALDQRVERIEKNVGPNGGKSLFDSQSRIEADLAFLKEAMMLDQVSPLFRATPGGLVEWANDRFAELVDLSSDDLLGNGWISAVCERDRERVVHEWESAVSQRRRLRMTFCVVGQDAREIKVSFRAFPMILHGVLAFFVGRIEPVVIERRARDRE